MQQLYFLTICFLFVIVTVPTTAAAIELIKIRKLFTRAVELLEDIKKK
ncbi:MAG: hypothetical protein JW893_04270 [Candidatus Omnitrophica bacterium]|nr:hypothetical protein [Candidatus Omnitrophota bacterium]